MLRKYTAHVQAEITDDIRAGTIPRDVGSFSELHDYVDANCYLIDVSEAYGIDISTDEGNDLLNEISDAVDRWLAAGACELGTGAACRCGRLVRFNGGAGGHWVHIDDRSHQCDACQFCR